MRRRPPEERLACRCRNFTLLLLAPLRAKGVPARARCGFAAYLNGISFASLHGLWFVAGSLVRDLAALNKVEMLPWDVWGAQPSPNELLDANQLDLFDQLAALTREPDSSFDQLRSTYQNTGSLVVPETVYNALLDHAEPAQGPESCAR